MSQANGSSSTPPPVPQRGTEVIDYLRRLNTWLKKTQALPGAGITSTQTGHGRTFNVRAAKKAAEVVPHPWKVTRDDAGEEKRVRVHPGSIDGVLPTNIFANLTITGTGVEYVVLTTNMLDAGVASCSLSIETDPPTPSGTAEDAAPDTLTDVIAVLMDGVIFQIRSTNLATQTELAVSIPTPQVVPWRENLIKFYKWRVIA